VTKIQVLPDESNTEDWTQFSWPFFDSSMLLAAGVNAKQLFKICFIILIEIVS
jgi:hypothetical protein